MSDDDIQAARLTFSLLDVSFNTIQFVQINSICVLFQLNGDGMLTFDELISAQVNHHQSNRLI